MQIDEIYELSNYLLNSNQLVKFKVGGYSMFPLLRDGDEIIVKKCNLRDLNVGDIVVCKTRNKWIAHRLIKINVQSEKIILITKGDTCKQKDPPLTEDKFIGKVISFLRNKKEKNLESNIINWKFYCFAKFSYLFTYIFRFRLWFNRHIFLKLKDYLKLRLRF